MRREPRPLYKYLAMEFFKNHRFLIKNINVMFKNVQAISDKSYQIFSYLAEKSRNGYFKQDAGRGYMPAVIENILNGEGWEHISLTHYGVCNGDLMADPEMIFFHDLKEHKAYAAYYRNDYASIEMNAIKFSDNGKPNKVHTDRQKDLTSFAELWMMNINEQQNLNF
jgi:hypothetical protein